MLSSMKPENLARNTVRCFSKQLRGKRIVLAIQSTTVSARDRFDVLVDMARMSLENNACGVVHLRCLSLLLEHAIRIASNIADLGHLPLIAITFESATLFPKNVILIEVAFVKY